jgi:hypothetical protein
LSVGTGTIERIIEVVCLPSFGSRMAVHGVVDNDSAVCIWGSGCSFGGTQDDREHMLAKE